MADQTNDSQTCNFFRKPSKTLTNLRKRKPQSSSSDSDTDSKAKPEPSHKPVKKNPNLHFTSSSKPSSNRSEAEPDKMFHFESSSRIQTQSDSRATATLETETDFSNDARAIRERILKKSSADPKSDDKKLYKGINAYTDYKAGFRREQTIASEKAGGAHGPLRASAHIRTTARFDYQPDICKDYKETGYCGFGDACKFMHDRGDYKSGWVLEKEWEEKEKARKRAIAMGEGKDSDDEDGNHDVDSDDENELPFACFICRKSFEDPVVTKCKHYFCEHCALKHHSKNKKCFVCNQPTMGIFNTAHEIRKRMAQEKEKV